jgi:hypothetical protein
MSFLQQLIERCRRQQQQIPGQLEMPDAEENAKLMAIYEEQSDFMRTLRIAASEILWASEFEAMEEWRSRTFEDFGFYPGWVEV